MVLNIILFIVIPWIFGVILYFLDKKTLLIIAPFFSMVAYLVNEFGYDLNYWRLLPINIDDDITSLSTIVGLYPVLAAYLIYFIRKEKVNPYLVVLLFSLLTTAAEYLGVIFHAIKYMNGWNVGWSFVCYALSYLMAFWYYKKLKKMGVF